MKSNLVCSINECYVLIAGLSRIVSSDFGKLVDDLRKTAGDVSIQLINSDIVYGQDHVKRILEITIESQKRKVMIANRPETDLIMRITYTGQFSLAVERGGPRCDSKACLILFSTGENVERTYHRIKETYNFQTDMSALEPSEAKKKRISSLLGISNEISEEGFLDYIVERAAIIH